jgi:hypothetical protein
MLCDQLILTAEVTDDVPADTLRICHQQIDEVVDHDRDVRTIDGLKLDHPIHSEAHDPSRYSAD